MSNHLHRVLKDKDTKRLKAQQILELVFMNYGVAADAGFILICSYSVNGSEPELILYKKR